MQLFVSYARVDKEIADAVVADGHALGHQVFYDRDLTGGQRWWDTLLDQIEGCQIFLPVLSDDYRGSEACQAEADWASANGIPFIPIVTAEQHPSLYDPVIAEANWVSYDPDSRGSLADLARGIAGAPSVVPPESRPGRPAIPLTYLNEIDRQLREAVDIPRGQQLTLISDLRSKLGTRDDRSARTLLVTLRARPEITHEAATMIDGLLAAPASPPREAAADPAPPRPAPSHPAPTPPTARAGGRARVVRVVLTLAAVTAVLVACFAAPWERVDRPFGEVSYALLEEGGGIPRWLGILALIGVLTSVALALTVQLVRTPPAVRAVATTALLTTAIIGVVGSSMVANDPIDSMSWGSVLLALGLFVLAVLTAVPALNASGRRAA